MKLHLKSITSLLTLALALTTSIAFSMDDLELEPKNTMEVPKSAIVLSSSKTKPIYSTGTSSSLFSAEEWVNIEIASGIVEDRIKRKQEILSYLKNETISLEHKMLQCQNDFGVVPYTPQVDDLERNIQGGIDSYCQYISMLLKTYTSVAQITQLLVNANTLEEKQYHQNSLYYLLSYEKKHFRDYIAQFYTHQIPEHSLEDTFYEMISSKLCERATKKYDVLNEWLIVSYGSDGIRKQIDNKKLLAHYQSIHKKLIQNFNKSHPIFWLSPIHPKIKEFSDPQVTLVENALTQCGNETTEITKLLIEKIDSYKETSPNYTENIISFYNEFGPLIIKIIERYEAVSRKIKAIEKNSTMWLKNFKENNNSFRKMTIQQRQTVREYLQEQEKIELTLKQEAERTAAALQVRKKPQRKRKENNKKAYTEKSRPTNLPKKEQLKQHDALTPMEKADTKIKFDDSIETPVPPISEPVFLSKSTPTVLPAPITQPKVKVKTRPNPLNIPEIAAEETEEKIIPLTLPEQYTTPEFNSFIESLLTERNGKKLVKSFKKLNTYGIFSETNEKNNKGYFSIRSPITDKIHVCTYHHLHVTENPYASIFMAVRDVLIAANIIER